VKLEIGGSNENHVDVLNCKSIKWRKNHTITPQLLPSSKVPVGWLQGHSWIEGEFELKTLSTVFDTYAPKNTDAIVIPYFVVFGETTAKVARTYTFSGLIIANPEQGLGTDGETVFTFKFLAYYVTEA
jgi:hypothetical protein